MQSGWQRTYAECPHCGWVHNTEGEEQPIHCHGCHKPFSEDQLPQLPYAAPSPITSEFLDELVEWTRSIGMLQSSTELAKMALKYQGDSPETFFDLYLKGIAPANAIDDFIDSWHANPRGMELYKFLGFTKEEYAIWLREPNCLDSMAKGRLAKTEDK